ncbi:MAG: hypothetical protein U0414_08320 [Polyangiaceae bacterium]
MALLVLYPSGASDAAAPRLAELMGSTAFEARMWIASAIPRVLARPDGERARALASALARDGFDAEVLEDLELERGLEVRAARSMQFQEAGLVFVDGALAWGDVATIVRAVSRGNVVRSTVTVEKVRVGRGGSVDVVRESSHEEHPKGELLYLFGAQGPAWLLAMDTLRYPTLGIPLRPTQRDNFNAVIERIRASAPRAYYDDELVRQGPPRHDVTRVRDSEVAAPVGPSAALDLAARLIHRARMRAAQHPYRSTR